MIKLIKIDINLNSEVIQASTVEEYRTDQEHQMAPDSIGGFRRNW